MDLCIPQEEGAEPKPLIDRLDKDEGRIKGLLLDTANLAAATTLSTIKHHDPLFGSQKVSEDVKTSWQMWVRSSRSLTSALIEAVLKGAV
jgi:hypothetical protein